jgi:C4-dicarboxylate transporter DctM subunit
VLKKAMRTVGQVFLLIASSTFLARALTVSQFPQKVTMFFDGFSPGVFLLMMNVLLLIVGCFFDPSAAILVLAPMLLPPALALGINPIHLGIVFVVNLVIGMFTPPFGLNIFVAQSVLGYDVKYISKCLVPYICLYLVALVLITAIPEISLWLPGMIAG